MAALPCFALAVVALFLIAPGASAATPYRSELDVSFATEAVRCWWFSPDGSPRNASGHGCNVLDLNGGNNGYYWCLGSLLEVRSATANADGSTTYDLRLVGVFGSPHLADAGSGYALAAAGATSGPKFFELFVTWTYAPNVGSVGIHASAATIRPDSCIGVGSGSNGLCNAGEIPAVVWVQSPTLVQGEGAVFDLIECIETTC
jgi:hypothetical protein